MSQPRTLPIAPCGPEFAPRLPWAPPLALMGVRFVEGEGGAAGTGTTTTTETGGAATTATPATAAAQTTAKTEPVKFEDLDATTQDYVRAHRTDKANAEREAAAAKAELENYKGQETERQKNILRAAGIKLEGDAETPEQIAERLAAQRIEADKTTAQHAAADRELALSRLALRPENLVNVDKLLDSRSFAAKLEGLDPTDTAGLQALLTEAVSKDASLRITPVAGSSGGHTPTGTGSPTGRMSKEDAFAARLANNRK